MSGEWEGAQKTERSRSVVRGGRRPERIGWDAGFGVTVTSLEHGPAATARVPHGQNFQPSAANTVVDPVANAVDVKAPYIRRTRPRNLGAQTWLLNEECERGFEISPYGTRRCGTICRPPFNDTVDCSGRAERDVEFERHS